MYRRRTLDNNQWDEGSKQMKLERVPYADTGNARHVDQETDTHVLWPALKVTAVRHKPTQNR